MIRTENPCISVAVSARKTSNLEQVSSETDIESPPEIQVPLPSVTTCPKGEEVDRKRLLLSAIASLIGFLVLDWTAMQLF